MLVVQKTMVRRLVFRPTPSTANIFTGGWESDGRSTLVSLAVEVTAAVMLVLSVMELGTGGVS